MTSASASLRSASVVALILRSVEFLFYHLLLRAVDRVSRLPRGETMPEAMRLYRENIALKAQLDRLGAQLALYETTRGRKPTPLRARAAEVFAYLLTRDDLVFRHYYLASSLRTIQRWASRFRRLDPRAGAVGRPETDPKIIGLVVTLKRENPGWGQRRIKQELARMGIKVSEPTIVKVLRDNGFAPFPHRPLSFDRVRSGAKDALWALDFFAVKTSKGVWLQGLLVIDIYTRELLELRAFDGWHVDSRWTIQVFNALLARTKRKPIAVLHDHGSHFGGQFHRGLAVLDIDDELTPVGLPSLNCYAESAIGSLRRELLRHVQVPDAPSLQFYLDEWRRYSNSDRAHQGIDGRTPLELSTSTPAAEVLELTELRARRLVRREYAHGLLHGYELVANDVVAEDATAA